MTRQLGPYTLVSKLGQGGMGEVHLAHDSRLERKVAIKLLPEALFSDAERRTRFLREARAVAQLSHPNITQIFDVGEADGRDYIAFELVEGRTLGELIAERPLSLVEVIDLALPLADAIAYAHERGIVHRDLKPANVMVTPRGHPKLLDFGLAKILQEGSQAPGASKTTTLTLQGAIFGTPGAMSPEQALGKPLDGRSDIFSFGSLLYEMASGRAAFGGAGVMEVMDAVIHREPDPLARLRADLPLGFVAIVEKALRKDPRERYQTMSDLAADLRHWKRTTDSGLLPPAKARGPALGLAIAGAALLLALAGWLAWRPRSQASAVTRQSLALLPFSSLGSSADDANFAAGLHSDILTRLSKISALKVISRNSVLEYAATKKSLRQIGDELAVSAILTGEVQRSPNALRLNLTLHDARTDDNLWAETYDRKLSSESLFEIQSSIAEEVARALQASLSPAEHALAAKIPTQNTEAYDLFMTGRLLVASTRVGDSQRAVETLEKVVELDPQFALAWAELAYARTELYWLFEATDKLLLESAFAAARRALALEPDLPEGHLQLGFCYYVSRDYERAEREYEIAEPGLSGNSRFLWCRACLHRRTGQWDLSRVEFARACELSPRDAGVIKDSSETYSYLGRRDEALGLVMRAEALAPGDSFDIERKHVLLNRDGRHPDSRAERDGYAARKLESQTYVELWRVRLMAREFDGARADLEHQPELMRFQHSIYPHALLLAIADELSGEAARARAGYEASRKLLETELAEHPDEPRLLAAMGLTLAGLGEKEAALAAARKSAELMPITRDAIVGSAIQLDLVYTQLRLGALDDALKSLGVYLAQPHFWSLAALALDPRFDVLRERAEFRAFAKG